MRGQNGCRRPLVNLGPRLVTYANYPIKLTIFSGQFTAATMRGSLGRSVDAPSDSLMVLACIAFAGGGGGFSSGRFNDLEGDCSRMPATIVEVGGTTAVRPGEPIGVLPAACRSHVCESGLSNVIEFSGPKVL